MFQAETYFLVERQNIVLKDESKIRKRKYIWLHILTDFTLEK